MYIKKLFRRIYPADGVTYHSKDDVEYQKLYGSLPLFSSNEGMAYIRNPLTLSFSFLGLPHRHRLTKLSSQQSVRNMLKNLIGWRDNINKRVNYTFIPLFVLLHLITVPVKFAINILKLFTELLPQTLTHYTIFLAQKFKWMGEDDDMVSRLYLVPAGLAFLLGSAFAIVTAVGSAITSPIDSFKYAARLSYMVKSDFLFVLLPALTLAFETFAYTIGIPLAIAAVVPALSAVTAIILSPLAIIGIGGFLVAIPFFIGGEYLHNLFYEDYIGSHWYDYHNLNIAVPVQQPILNPAEENDEEDDLPNTAGIMRQLGGPQQSVVGTPNPSTPLVNTTIPAHPEAKVQEDDFTYTPSSTFSFASQK